MPRTWFSRIAMLAFALFALAACIQPIQPEDGGDAAMDESPASEEVTMYVGPELADCVGVAPMQCMLVKTDPDADYEFFYASIEGFEFEPGYEYELRVLVETVENPPADGSSLKYTLIEEVSKTPVELTPMPEAEAGDAPTLEGTVWEVVRYVDAGGAEVEPVPGAQPTARFEDGQIGGSTGCNNYFGSYSLDGDRLEMGQVGSTMMACPEPLMTQETDFLLALNSITGYTLEDETLSLLDGGGAPVIVLQPQQQVALVGTDWRVTFYNNGRGGFTSVLADTEMTALFDDAGNVGGTAGCNGYGASYTTDGHMIEIGPVISTMMFCEEPEGAMDQEQAYLAALETAATYDIQADVLTLFAADGARAAEFVAAAVEGAADEAGAADSAVVMSDDPAAKLGNMTIPNEFGEEGEVQLEDGAYVGPPAAPGAATRPTVNLTDFVAEGSLGGEDAIAGIVVSSGGGSGSFYELVVIQGTLDDPSTLATAFLGDRVQINSLAIEDDQVVVDMINQGPDDPMCCPTQNVVRTYALQDGELVQTGEEVVGAAAEPAAPAAGAAAGGETSLEGSAWAATSFVDAEGNVLDAMPTAPPTIAFDAGQVSGTTGCNSYSGGYTVDGDQLTIGPLAMTAMACIGPVADQEVAYLAALEQVATYRITAAGNLELLDAEGNVLISYQLQELPELTGTDWRAIGYNNGNQAVVTLLQGTEITALFGEDGTLSGSASCNRYNASYTVEGGAIQIGPAATTRMLCPSEIMEQEAAYLAALELAAVYMIDGDRLQIRDADGALLADYRPADVLAAEMEAIEAAGDVAAEAEAPAEQPAAPLLPNRADALEIDTGLLADSYHWRIAPPTPYEGNVPAPGGLPQRVVITFDNQTPDVAERDNGPLIYILPVAEYAAAWEAEGNDAITTNVAALQALLAERPENPSAPLMLLPPAPAVNDLAVQTAYLDTDQFSGVRYVGRFVQDAVPAANGQFYYYFQGLSNDGQRYIAARWPVVTPALPASGEDVSQTEQDAVTQDPAGYLAATAETLNGLAPSDWRPDLSALDALITSLTLTLPPAADAGAESAASTGLVGPIWAWQQTQGGDDSVTAVDEPSRYTIQFMEDGSAAIRADCNRVGATYTVDDSLLQIQTTMSTMALCPEDSLDGQFLEELGFVRSYVFEEGKLYLSMMADAGIMEFAPLP